MTSEILQTSADILQNIFWESWKLIEAFTE